jgi:hypothetical protein
MHLVQLLLPAGREPRRYDKVMRELTERFGGVTTYSRAPALGLWKDTAHSTEADDIVVFEVMVEELDPTWWAGYRRSLEEVFEQRELVVRAQEMRRL